MGSSGSGRLTDYPGSSRQPASKPGSSGGATGGGPSGGDPCLLERDQVALEEIERCDYFPSVGEVPPPGTDVVVLPELVDGRIAVAMASTRATLGYLPTEHNDLVSCLERFDYVGEVTSSQASPLPRITVRIRPSIA